MQITRRRQQTVVVNPSTRALKVNTAVNDSSHYALHVNDTLYVEPYAKQPDALFFDVDDGDQLVWPAAHDAVIKRDQCDLLKFKLIKDNPTGTTLETQSDDCPASWKPAADCTEATCQPCGTDVPSCSTGCSCADLKGSTCPSCLHSETIVAVHAPAY